MQHQSGCDNPLFLRGAGHSSRFRLRPEYSVEDLFDLVTAVMREQPPVGMTSLRVLQFDDGSLLHRMTFTSVAAWRRHARSMDKVLVFTENVRRMSDPDSVEMWLGANTVIPERFAPDLANPRVPRPVDPKGPDVGRHCDGTRWGAGGPAPPQTRGGGRSDVTRRILDIEVSTPDDVDPAWCTPSVIGKLELSFGGEPDDDDEDDDADSHVSGSLVFASAAIASKLSWVRRSSTSSVSSSIFSDTADILCPSPAALAGLSLTAHPASRPYTEARSSVGIHTPSSDGGATPHGYGSYWRSSVWQVPPHAASPAAGSQVPRPRLTVDAHAAREMLPHVPRALPVPAGYTRAHVAGPQPFVILIDGRAPRRNTATRRVESMSATVAVSAAVDTTATAPKVIRLPPIPSAPALPPKSLPPPDRRPAVRRGSSVGNAAKGSGDSGAFTHAALDDDSASVATVASSAHVPSSASSDTAANLALSSRSSMASGSSAGRSRRVLSVLVALDDGSKKRCKCDTARCREPRPGQAVAVRGLGDVKDSVATARVVAVSAWSNAKSGGSSGAPPTVIKTLGDAAIAAPASS